MTKVRKRPRDADFALPPKERAVYGATVTARSMVTGKTRTFARTDTTAVKAVSEIIDELVLLPGDFRIVTISTPVSIQRDMYASRIELNGLNKGIMPGTPEQMMLGRMGRLDMLHPSTIRISEGNAA